MDTLTPQPPPIDPEVIEMLASLQEPGEPDLVVELVTLFLRDTPQRLEILRARPLEAAATARVAHAVKGSAGNLGATQLQDLASQLEQAGHRGAASEVLVDMADTVFEEYARVERHLQAMLDARIGRES
jgi:HPt (histidine-containing phosphotransfer) domain-containing protein